MKSICFEYTVETIAALGVFLNLWLIWKVYKAGQNKTDQHTEQQRKLQMFQAFVLDYNIKYLYEFFEKLINKTDELRQAGLTDAEKGEINEALIVLNKNFRIQFVDSVNAIDQDLYREILIESDQMIDSFGEAIFDQGINLSHPPKFEECVGNKIFATKTAILKKLMSHNPL